MGIMPFFTDTLYNLISGLGTSKDKATFTRYVFVEMGKDQLDAAYRSDWVARKIIDIPAKDSTREWRAWQADSDAIQALEECERALGIKQKLQLSLIRARLYGGCALVMGVGNDDPTTELRPELVKKGDLKFVHSIGRWEMRTGPIDWDVTSPYYGEPSYYERNVSGVTVDPQNEQMGIGVRIHPSRVVRLVGAPVPDPAVNTNMGWGDSVLQSVIDAVQNSSMVTSSVATLMSEAKIDVIKIPGLSENISTDEYKTRLTNRFAYANTAKSIVNTLVLDKEEEWDRMEANLGALTPLIQLYMSVAAGAADIPATRMLGQAPDGMNATGASDIRNYYDRISSDQDTDLTPALSRLDEVLIRSALGSRDESIHYVWNPLWQLDDVQKGALALQKAQAFQIDVTAALIPPEVLREARENQLIEDGTYPGLEQTLDDFESGELPEDPEPEMPALPPGAAPPLALPKPGTPVAKPAAPSGASKNLPSSDARHGHRNQRGKFRRVPEHIRLLHRSMTEHMAQMQESMRQIIVSLPDGEPIADATTPRTLYVSRKVLNGRAIRNWAIGQGVPAECVCDPAEMHVTIAFSRTPVDWLTMGGESGWGQDDEGNMTVPPGGPRVVEMFGPEGNKDWLVLAFSFSPLCWRHEDMKNRGASWDWPDYNPHVTFARGCVLKITEPYTGVIELGPEIFEEIDEDRAK